MATINLLERDGILLRLPDVKCPVLWLHVSSTCSTIHSDANCVSPCYQGTADPVYSVPHGKHNHSLFVASERTKFVVVEGGAHYLSISRPKEVIEEVLAFYAA